MSFKAAHLGERFATSALRPRQPQSSGIGDLLPSERRLHQHSPRSLNQTRGSMVKWLVIAVFLMSGTGAASAQVADSGLQNVADPEASAGPNAPQTSVDVSEAPAADDPAPKAVRTGSEDSGSGARAGKASAYNRGRLDRQAWQVWFAAQSGDTHAGAAYWVCRTSPS